MSYVFKDKRRDQRQALPKGEAITCENGHVVCTLRRPLSLGGIIHAANMVERQPGFDPVEGEAMGMCRECGAAFNRARPNGNAALHTEQGWFGVPER